MELTHDMLTRLEKLQKKFDVMGQDMESYLDGLLHADYLTYWDYIHLDTLLSLQTPKTRILDERIFIMYHQITELYFRLILDAYERLAKDENRTAKLFKRQIKRINTYFKILVDSFGVMVGGLDKEEFLKFRMSLLPASGFQSAQYREIEVVSTSFQQLIHHTKREQIDANSSIPEMYEHLYWKTGATELATGKKTLTLRQFEEKYGQFFVILAGDVQNTNIRSLYQSLTKEERADKELINLLREHDLNANVRWPLSHFRAAVQYMDRKPEVISATGGTNWQKYLPPMNQRIIFYPELWSEEELAAWGTQQFI
ncbi:MAG: tryptophan 2,3-dioxygenase [Maribacter sp.]|jgi:tryptophan 2,3-dioxygenase